MRSWKQFICAGLAVVGFAGQSLQFATAVAAPVAESPGATIAVVEQPLPAMQQPLTPPEDVEGGARRKLWVCAGAIALAIGACAFGPVTGIVGVGAAVILCS